MQRQTNRFEAINVVIDGKKGGDDYEITGINSDGKTETFTAGALNLNGYGMATSSMEIGEYGMTVTIEQDVGSRYVNIKTEAEN